MSQVIYRKYRPKTFKEVVGQRAVKLTLENEIQSQNVAHAYLFVGPRGTGKTTLARLFARSLNCLNRKDSSSEPCGDCDICNLILENRSMDVIEIDAASHTGVDNVRENIIANAQVPPFNSKGFKVFIVDEVHMLSKSAFNALLKTLEEPPRQVIFILATTEIHKVPETIISRTQRFDLKKLTHTEIVGRLTEILEWEKVSMPEKLLPEIARKAEGSLRDAESILEQIISLSNGKVTEELASLVLPRSNWQEVNILVESLRLKNMPAALNQINKLVTEGVDLHSFNNDLIDYLRQIMLYGIIGSDYELDYAEEFNKAIKEHAAEWPLTDLSRLINILLTKYAIKQSLIDQLPLELAVVEYLQNKAVKRTDGDGSTEKKEKSPSRIIVDSDDLSIMQSQWSNFVESTKDLNHSLSMFLQAAHPLEISDNQIIIGVEFEFHLQQMDKPQVKGHLSKLFSDSLGRKLEVSFKTDENHKENHASFKGKNEDGVGEALETFGGEVL